MTSSRKWPRRSPPPFSTTRPARRLRRSSLRAFPGHRWCLDVLMFVEKDVVRLLLDTVSGESAILGMTLYLSFTKKGCCQRDIFDQFLSTGRSSSSWWTPEGLRGGRRGSWRSFNPRKAKCGNFLRRPSVWTFWSDNDSWWDKYPQQPDATGPITIEKSWCFFRILSKLPPPNLDNLYHFF